MAAAAVATSARTTMFYSGYSPPPPLPATANGHVGSTSTSTAHPGGPMSAPATTNGSSSLFSANELQALDGFFNWQLMPQPQPQAAPSSFVSYARTSAPPPSSANYSLQHSYYPTNGIVQSTSLKQGYAKAPSITSDASERIETSQERDRRMKAQADDLASWLAQYNPTGPIASTSAQTTDARRASAQPASLQIPSRSDNIQSGAPPQRRSLAGSPERSTLTAEYGPASGCVASSAPDTFRHPNLPASHPSVGTSSTSSSSINARRKSQDMLASDNGLDAQDGSVASKRQRHAIGGDNDVSVPSIAQRASVREDGMSMPLSDEEHDMPVGDTLPPPDTRTAKGKGKARGKTSAAPKKTKSAPTSKGPRRTSVSSAPTAAAGVRRANAKVKAERDAVDIDQQHDDGSPSLHAGLEDSVQKSASPAEAAGSSAVQRSSSSKVDAGPKVVLTDEQKRANHIASEQKRRTAIRLAYDELCNVVPSLSSAVKEYEERLSKLQQGAGGTAAGEGTVAGALTGGIDVGGEKVDGRAGPKSEAVVLGKTVEYMRELLEDREALLADYEQLLQESDTSHLAADDKSAPWNRKWSSKAMSY